MAKRIWLMGMIVFDFLDLVSTHVALSAGLAEEMNPIAAHFIDKFGFVIGIWVIGALLKIAAILFALLAWPYFEFKTTKSAFHSFCGTLYLLLLLRICVVFNHILIITSG